jgi:bacillithiol biosynthesis cysteine-adding enzyme BshC
VPEVLAKIDVKTLGDGNALFLDYVGRPRTGIPPFMPSLQSHFSTWSGGDPPELRGLGTPEQKGWHHVIDEIARLSKRLGADEAILRKIDRAKTREARFVVTGQQPGALGGPLYAVYKVATAIALANRLEAVLGLPCVPLYWCGADDTDFREIRDVHVMTGQLSVVTASIDQRGHHGGMPVGDIETNWLAEVWQSIRSFVEEQPRGSAVIKTVDHAFSAARDHGELSAAIVIGLLGGHCAVVDGRSAEVRRYASPVFADYVEREDELKKEVVDSGRSLQQAGYHSQLSIGEDSGVFVIEDGRRRTVSPDQRSSLIDAVTNRVETCSPGVILRNLVQDYAFEPVAVVSGPAEIAYRAQIASLYKRFNLPRPADFPRMTATFAPAQLADLLRIESGPDAETLVRDPSRFAKSIYRSQTPPRLRAAASEFASDAHGWLDRLSKQAEADLSTKSRGRMRGKLDEFRNRVDYLSESVLETGKTAALERWPFLTELAQLIRPGDKPQERRLSLIVPFVNARDSDSDPMTRLASVHVDELMDGRMLHIVYSSKS